MNTLFYLGLTALVLSIVACVVLYILLYNKKEEIRDAKSCIQFRVEQLYLSICNEEKRIGEIKETSGSGDFYLLDILQIKNLLVESGSNYKEKILEYAMWNAYLSSVEAYYKTVLSLGVYTNSVTDKKKAFYNTQIMIHKILLSKIKEDLGDNSVNQLAVRNSAKSVVATKLDNLTDLEIAILLDESISVLSKLLHYELFK